LVATRERRPIAVLVTDPGLEGAVAVRALPDEPFSLRGVRAHGFVHDEHDCDAVLVALARGADVVIAIDLPASKRVELLDDISRIADVRQAKLLTSDERAVVDGLVEGQTLTEVARSLGMSRRTATRRLAAAKLAFGAATTIELILAVSHSVS
jgi:DNA-binding NarL/FixJ family response regulator